MQANLPDDSLVRETMASLGPGSKDATLDDLAAWIRQLEELCDSQDPALAPASFRTDIRGSCLSKFPASETPAERTKLQTKVVKGYSPLPELHIEKVNSKKKNARGEAKLHLSVERGPVLVLLTINDLHGTTRTLCVVTADNNDLIPIRHPATTIEATAIPIAPDQLLERLRLVEAKIKEQRQEQVQRSASSKPHVEKTSAQRQADGVEYTSMNDVFAPLLKIALENHALGNPFTASELRKRWEALSKEEKAIKKKLPTSKPAEKKRLLEELENKNVDYAKLMAVMFRTAGGGWKDVSQEQYAPLFEKAKQKDQQSAKVLAWRAQVAVDEYNELAEKYNTLVEKLESTANPNKKKRLSTQLGRKEIEFDATMNAIAAFAAGGWLGVACAENEELIALSVKASQKNPALAYRALDALTEYNKLVEKLESISNPTKRNRLATLLGRKHIEFEEAMNEVAAIACDSKELNDVFTRMNEALVLGQSP